MSIAFIYGIIDPRSNDICYVGKSTIGELRWNIHTAELNRGAHFNIRLQRLFNKLKREGLGELSFRILEQCPREDLSDKEVKWISECKSKGIDLCNVHEGGGPLGFKHSEETRRKISERKKGKKYKWSSPEAREKFIEKQKLREVSEKQLAALAIPRKDPEVHAKMIAAVKEGSKKRIGIPLSEEHRQSLRKPKTDRGGMTRGESHYLSKLTENDVLEIRKVYGTKVDGKKQTYRRLAEKYGVGFGTIVHVVKGNTWKHLLNKDVER